MLRSGICNFMQKGSEKFHSLLKEIGDLHDKKQQDYGREGDPFANVRASSDFSVQSWIGAMIRANDKMRRIQKYAKSGDLANESVRDSFMDLAVYSLIALILWEEDYKYQSLTILPTPAKR